MNKQTYLWRYIVDYEGRGYGSLNPPEIGYILSKSNEAVTVCDEIYSEFGEGFKIVELALKSDNVIIYP